MHPTWRRLCLLVIVFGMPWGCAGSKCTSTLERRSSAAQGEAGAPTGPPEHFAQVPGPSSYSSGWEACPPPQGPCTTMADPPDHVERCGAYDRVACEPGCDGYRTQRYTCETDVWRLVESHEPACRCEPAKAYSELADCSVQYVNVRPSESSLTDHCTLALSCAGSELLLGCSAEHDGTNTSLCECWRDGRQERMVGGPTPGEGPDACFAAAALCIKARDVDWL